MRGDWAARLRAGVGLMLLVAVASATWWGLERAEPRADWVRVEAPRRAVEGQPFPMRVHLAPLAEPMVLCADLHWGTSRDDAIGYLASGGTRAVGKDGGTFDFEIPVPPRPGLRFVNGIVYLSRTGSWPDHTLAAATEVIPVSAKPGDKLETRLEQLRVQPPGVDAGSHSRPAALPRVLTGLLLLAAAIAAWAAAAPGKHAGGSPVERGRKWQAVVVALALACLWELLGIESWLAAQARALARTEDFYYPRSMLQKGVVSLTLAAMPLLILCIQRARRGERLLLASIALYLVVTVLNLVSLHVIDQVADVAWHGLTLDQTLKFLCAAFVLAGVRRAARWQGLRPN